VFASSHLLAEMALMADHVVVIGRGRLMSDEPMTDFVARSSRTSVVVRSPRVDRLAALLTRDGASVVREAPDRIAVTGADQTQIGAIAFANGVVLHELATRAATLEEAFLEVTEAAEEFRVRPGNGLGQAPLAQPSVPASPVPRGDR
jgi:ABC-2 type transport system ATP-binding protein